MSEVRGSSREELPHVQCQWRPWELPHLRGQGQWPGGDTPRSRSGKPEEATSHPRPRAMTMRSHPEPEAKGYSWEEPPTPEARACVWEEHREQQWLCRHRRA